MKKYECIPYKCVGDFHFGMTRSQIHKLLGEPDSTQMYGFPTENRFLDSYGFFHILCNSTSSFEAIELFPDILTDDTIIFTFGDTVVELSTNIEKTLAEFAKVTDDFVWVDEEEGYSSQKLGMKIYCPEGYAEDIIIHDEHCYDEENEYLEMLEDN